MYVRARTPMSVSATRSASAADALMTALRRSREKGAVRLSSYNARYNCRRDEPLDCPLGSLLRRGRVHRQLNVPTNTVRPSSDSRERTGALDSPRLWRGYCGVAFCHNRSVSLKQRDCRDLLDGIVSNLVQYQLESGAVLRPRQPRGALDVPDPLFGGAPGTLLDQAIGDIPIIDDGLHQ